MFNSRKYWEDRYVRGGNSGAGSYNDLAIFKASVINTFVKDHAVKSIIDYGVGDGNQLTLLDLSGILYTGVDVSQIAVDRCKALFSDDATKQFYNTDHFEAGRTADLVLSCDVLYHLIEDRVFQDYVGELFRRSNNYVIIYARDADLNHAPHVKFRKFTPYIASHHPDFVLHSHIPNKYPQLVIGQQNDTTSPSDFYIYKRCVETTPIQ